MRKKSYACMMSTVCNTVVANSVSRISSCVIVVISFALRGGITLTFTGENLDVAQNPQLVFSDGARVSLLIPPHSTLPLQSPCSVRSSTTLTCITPPVDAAVDMPTYVLVLDNAPFPEVLPEDLQVSVSPTPTGFTLITDSVQIGAESRFIQIEVSRQYIEHKLPLIKSAFPPPPPPPPMGQV